MKNLNQLTIAINTRTREKLKSTNAALMQIDEPLLHHLWCSGGLPFKSPVVEYKSDDEPVLSWTAQDLDGSFAGQLELHKNRFGWILARLWVNEDWRRCGLARTLRLIALDCAFQFTDVVGAFCDVRNIKSWSLQTSMGFVTVKEWPEINVALRTLKRSDYEKYRPFIAPLINRQALAPRPCADPLQTEQCTSANQ